MDYNFALSPILSIVHYVFHLSVLLEVYVLLDSYSFARFVGVGSRFGDVGLKAYKQAYYFSKGVMEAVFSCRGHLKD